MHLNLGSSLYRLGFFPVRHAVSQGRHHLKRLGHFFILSIQRQNEEGGAGLGDLQRTFTIPEFLIEQSANATSRLATHQRTHNSVFEGLATPSYHSQI